MGLKTIIASGLVMVTMAMIMISAAPTPDGLSAPSAQKQGVFKFITNKVVMDSVVRGEKRKAQFLFTNSGDAAFEIDRVRSDCGCTVADYPRDMIMPGDTAAITVTYDSSGTYYGEAHRYIYVRSTASNPRAVAFLSTRVVRK